MAGNCGKKDEKAAGGEKVELIPDQNSGPWMFRHSAIFQQQSEKPKCVLKKNLQQYMSSQSSPGIRDVSGILSLLQTSLYFSLGDVAATVAVTIILYMTSLYEDLTQSCVQVYTDLQVYICIQKPLLVTIPPILWKYQNIFYWLCCAKSL